VGSSWGAGQLLWWCAGGWLVLYQARGRTPAGAAAFARESTPPAPVSGSSQPSPTHPPPTHPPSPQRWNPAVDPHIAVNYSLKDFKAGKAANKAALQKELGLPVDPDVPLLVGIELATS
jgi:hypothetical protein